MITMRALSLLHSVAIALATTSAVSAGDWSAYRGPRGDGISAENIKSEWAGGKPRELWRVPTPGGFSSFAVAGGRCFTLVTRAGAAQAETLIALDAATGKELWSQPIGLGKYPGGGDSGAPDNKGGDGPRSTPTVAGDKVYTYSAEMLVHCFEAATGKPVWQKDIIKEFHGANIQWKSAASPVVDGKLLFVAGGGPEQSLLAFDRETGAVAWKAGTELLTHASPIVTTLHGVKQVIFVAQSGLVAHEAETGKPLWKFGHRYRTSTACLPIVSGDLVFITAGYEVGGAVCRVVKTGSGFAAEPVWSARGNKPAASLWSPPIAHDQHLYGMISYKQFGDGPLKCLDLKTGALKWEKPGFGAGNVLLAANTLVALTDDGRVVLVKPSPEACQEIAQFKALAGKCWSTPALSDGKLYVRSTKEGACFDLGGK